MNKCPFKHTRLSDFQQNMTRGKWNCPIFLVVGQFLSVFIFLRPLSYESAFLIQTTRIEFLALQKSEVLGNFGFLESQKFDPSKKATLHNNYITRSKTRRDKNGQKIY